MSIIENFPGLAGFYVLTSDGEFGHYDADNKFVLDTKLSKVFSDYNRRFLMAYHQNPDQGNFRLAIIYRTQEKRPWGSDTLFFEKHILRRLYPVTGLTTEMDLTAFQRKNREKSIYRGMELFLDYKDGSNPGMPVFMPVLYDRGMMLDDYASILGRQVTSVDRETPVVEVINLVAAIPISKRFSTEIAILKEKIYRGSVKKGMRKASEFTLVDEIQSHAQPPRLGSDDLYGEVDSRADRNVSFDSLAAKGSSAIGHEHDSKFINSIASSMVGRPEPADVGTLKTFIRFQNMDIEKLEALAAKCLIYKVPPGTQLLERGTSDSWNLYLVDGTVRLIAADGREKLIDGDTSNASNPISSLKPRMYTVVSVTRVAFLWIDDQLVEKIVGDKPAPFKIGGKA